MDRRVNRPKEAAVAYIQALKHSELTFEAMALSFKSIIKTRQLDTIQDLITRVERNGEASGRFYGKFGRALQATLGSTAKYSTVELVNLADSLKLEKGARCHREPSVDFCVQQVSHAIGHLYDQAGRHAAAWREWSSANSAKRSAAGTKLGFVAAQLKLMRAAPILWAQNSGLGTSVVSCSARPIFIVGMPRFARSKHSLHFVVSANEPSGHMARLVVGRGLPCSKRCSWHIPV